MSQVVEGDKMIDPRWTVLSGYARFCRTLAENVSCRAEEVLHTQKPDLQQAIQCQMYAEALQLAAADMAVQADFLREAEDRRESFRKVSEQVLGSEGQ